MSNMVHAAHTPRKLTRDEFMRMSELGVLRPGEHCELLGGQLYAMPPQTPDHSNTTTAIADALHAVYPQGSRGCRIKQHSPLDCGLYDIPEPDVAVVRDSAFMREKRHPRADETYLVVEVAKTSVKEDRSKAQQYLAGSAPVYWLVDLEARAIEVYKLSDGYQRAVLTGAAQLTVPGTLVVWTVDYILSLAA